MSSARSVPALPCPAASPAFPHPLRGARQRSEPVTQHQAGEQNIQVTHPAHSQDTYSYNLGDSSAAASEEGGQNLA